MDKQNGKPGKDVDIELLPGLEQKRVTGEGEITDQEVIQQLNLIQNTLLKISIEKGIPILDLVAQLQVHFLDDSSVEQSKRVTDLLEEIGRRVQLDNEGEGEY